MAKLSEAIADKGKKGNWYSVKDVIGKTLTVTEDMGVNYDIRVEEKYYCIQVSCDGQVKDLHTTKGSLKAVAKAFASRENWKGGRFVITGVTGTGYQTETHVSLLTGDYAPGEQARLPQTSQDAPKPASPSNMPVDPKAAAIAACLAVIKGGVGIHESRLDDMVRDVCIAKGLVVAGSEIVTALKYGGRIKNEGGVWMVV